MIIRFLIMVITFLWVIFWLTRRKAVRTPDKAKQVTDLSRDWEESKVIEDAQAAEVVATWNLLNPPSS